MALITESELRKLLKDKDFKELKVLKGEIITPSAKSFLRDNNVELKYVDSKEEVKVESENKKVTTEDVHFKNTEKSSAYKYKTLFGAELNNKPEYMTQLYGNILVFKDHKRILFRGKMDSLEGKILQTQILCLKLNHNKLVEDLQEILDFVRNLVKCEVLNESVREFSLQNMTPIDLREKSHYPEKYFGIGHFFPDCSMGEVVIELNSCRTFTREAELVAYEAFKGQSGEVNREDIIKGLNRLSSLFYIMMFKCRTGKYNSEER